VGLGPRGRTSRNLRSSREHLNGGGHRVGSRLVPCAASTASPGAIKVGWQDPARGQDGHPQRRSPRHRRLHRVQGRGRSARRGRSSTPATTAAFNVPGGAYRPSIAYQNANHSVRVTDEFMESVLRDGEWKTRGPDRPSRGRHLQGAAPPPSQDLRGGAPVRRSRHAVRYHRETPTTRARRRRASTPSKPVLRVHVPRRLGVQTSRP